MVATWELSNSLKIRPIARVNNPHTICAEFSFFYKFQQKKYKEYDTLFIGDGALENKKQG